MHGSTIERFLARWWCESCQVGGREDGRAGARAFLAHKAEAGCAGHWRFVGNAWPAMTKTLGAMAPRWEVAAFVA